MPIPLYTQTVIAFIWDFDRTLIPGNMQDPIFEHYGVEPQTFWEEVEGLVAHYGRRGIPISRDAAYLGHILTYVAEGLFPDLTNDKLKELGTHLEMSPGIPDFLEATRKRIAADATLAGEGIRVEHYIVSTGILPMIQGCSIAPHVDGVWANSFIETPAPSGYLQHLPVAADEPQPVSRIGYTIDNTTKTRAVFEINKGVNKNPAIDVNAKMSDDQRRVPIANMIYIADGPSDVPVFSILNKLGGKTLGVYTTEPRNNFRQVRLLQEQGRIQGMAEADYRPGQAAHMWLMDSLDQIASNIITARRRALDDIPRPPGHV